MQLITLRGISIEVQEMHIFARELAIFEYVRIFHVEVRKGGTFLTSKLFQFTIVLKTRSSAYYFSTAYVHNLVVV